MFCIFEIAHKFLIMNLYYGPWGEIYKKGIHKYTPIWVGLMDGDMTEWYQSYWLHHQGCMGQNP